MNKRSRQYQVRQKLRQLRETGRQKLAQATAPPPSLEESHPSVIIARAICPSMSGWCWQPRRVDGHDTVVPINFEHFDNLTRLLAWLGEQAWYEALTAVHQQLSQLFARFALEEITLPQLSHAVQTAVVHAIQNH